MTVSWRLPSWLRPARSVPVVRWRAPTRWRGSPSTLVVLVVGQVLFGAGEAFLVAADLGVSPWTVLAQGLSVRLGVGIGATSFLVGASVLLLWLPLRERPGLGTLTNVVLISVTLQVVAGVLPRPGAFGVQLLLVLAGVALIGLGSGLYLTTGLGPGPRDGWMTGIHHRTGWPVTVVRLSIELLVLLVGWSLGGTVGVGTVVFALLIGPSVGWGLLLAGRVGRAPDRPPENRLDEDHPELDA